MIKFWENGRKVKIGPPLPFRGYISGLFNNSMIYKLIGTIEDHISHVLAQFQNISLIKLEKMPEKWKSDLFGPFGPKKQGLERFNDIHLYTQHQWVDSNWHAFEWKSQNWLNSFWENGRKWISGQFGPLRPKRRGFIAIPWHPSVYTTSMTSIAMLWNKNLKTDSTVFEQMTEKWILGLFGSFGPKIRGSGAIQRLNCHALE